MCISLLLFDAHPALLLLLTFNRDEFYDRPTLPAHFWPEEPDLLAGRDALRQGTWLGVTRRGRFALLTNFREPLCGANGASQFVKTTNAPTRGALTTDFLRSDTPPLEYAQSLDLGAYCGFNLLVGDLHAKQLAYVSNRDPLGARLLEPGHYGLSNGLLSEWPKVHKALRRAAGALDGSAAKGRANGAAPGGDEAAAAGDAAAAAAAPAATAAAAGAASAASAASVPSSAAGAGEAGSSSGGDGDGDGDGVSEQQQELPWSELFHHVMGDRQPLGPDEQVPLTGVGEALDRRLSAVFIEPFEMQPGTTYGTRSQTVIAVWRDGRMEQRERYVERVQQQPGAAGAEQQPQPQQPQQPAAAAANGSGRGEQQAQEEEEEEEEEVAWTWREQVHTFELACPAHCAAAERGDGGSRQLHRQGTEARCMCCGKH